MFIVRKEWKPQSFNTEAQRHGGTEQVKSSLNCLCVSATLCLCVKSDRCRAAWELFFEFAHLLGDPLFQLGHIYGRELGEVGTEALGVFDIDVANFVLCLVGVPVDQHANTAPQAAWHIDLIGTKQRNVDPAELPGGQGGKFSVEVAGQAEHGAG